ncbi:MAG: S49 family peptidase [Hyphomicrobium sp.]|nr:S49 family peptidase [Hyphomicrobium sp.]
MWPFTRTPIVPVVRLYGPIGAATPLRPGLSIASVASALERAFELSKTPSVAIVVNSPGGSPVQSNLIMSRIRHLAGEKKKRVYVFCEDVAASGGYFIACAGDEIYADPSSIVGSIGVINATFGLDRVIDRLGVDYRLYTAGRSKSVLDPFRPEKPEDVARIKDMLAEIHDVFIGVVKDRRAGKIKGPDEELFSGAFWTGAKALEYGLVDGIGDVRTKMREVHGPHVKLKVVPIEKQGILAWFRRAPETGHADAPGAIRHHFADDVISSLEARALWSRYGL